MVKFGRYKGQAVVEALLALPLLLFISFAVLQILWLIWAQQMLQVASAQAARAAALQQGQVAVAEAELAAAMLGVEPQALASMRSGATVELGRAYLQQRLWVKQIAALKIMEFGEAERQLAVTKDKQRVIPWSHLPLRYQLSTQPELEQRARTLTLRIRWCQPLRLPLIGTFFSWVAAQSKHPAQRFCQARQQLVGIPLWGLQHQVSSPMLSDRLVLPE